jgi:hypothetical protein
MRQSFVVACLICLISACDKNEAGTPRKFISLQLDGQVILAENPTATLTTPNLTDGDPNNDFPTLKITGVGGKGEVLSFTFISETLPFKIGTYQSTQQGNGMAIAYNDSAYTLIADNNNGYLDFNLVTVQDSLIEGNFTGLVEDTTGTISIRPVTDGYLRAIIKSSN